MPNGIPRQVPSSTHPSIYSSSVHPSTNYPHIHPSSYSCTHPSVTSIHLPTYPCTHPLIISTHIHASTHPLTHPSQTLGVSYGPGTLPSRDVPSPSRSLQSSEWTAHSSYRWLVLGDRHRRRATEGNEAHIPSTLHSKSPP